MWAEPCYFPEPSSEKLDEKMQYILLVRPSCRLIFMGGGAFERVHDFGQSCPCVVWYSSLSSIFLFTHGARTRTDLAH
jgi:hypothetical protein